MSMKKTRIAAFLCTLLLTVTLLVAPVGAAGYTPPDTTKIHATAAILVNLAGNAEGDGVL